MKGEAARALLARIVDYAGLFPPAGLGMAEAVAEYAALRGTAEAWMLGRFVVPAGRLDALRSACERIAGAPGAPTPVLPWDLSVLASADSADLAAAAALPPGLVLDAVEGKAASFEEVEALLAAWRPRGVPVYVELPLHGNLETLLHAVRRGDGRAKLRTGGVTAEAFPAPEDVARFLAACARHRVPVKFTAGLHHPLRGEHPLTYEKDAPRGVMHGFLNVFAAAALARAGAPEAELVAVLREADPAAFAFDGAAFLVRGRRLEQAALLALREEFAAGFGSCSFREPVADLRALGVLAPAVSA